MWQMSAIPVAEAALSFASGASACYAAFYWFKSTKVPIPSSLAGINTHSVSYTHLTLPTNREV